MLAGGFGPIWRDGRIDRMDGGLFWRTVGVQAAAVALVSLVLGVALPEDFFEEWGWLAGPGAWMACAALTARLLDIPLRPALLGAALAGLPSLLAVLVGLHWVGALVAVFLFAAWCARIGRREVAWT
jgi:hypothetical protein